MDATLKKEKGVHYTPPKLARFLALQTVQCLRRKHARVVSVLDPACGDGELLMSIATQLQEQFPRVQLELTGFELDESAIDEAGARLKNLSNCRVKLLNEDFLATNVNSSRFDVVIANPPYVRTQVLGRHTSKKLANKFGLKGRVDLYHAFVVGIHDALKPDGCMGLLTSNRFLTVKSGEAIRQLLANEFELRSVIDLGDTRLFEAAVLPAIVTGTKRSASVDTTTTTFTRVYRNDQDEMSSQVFEGSALDALSNHHATGVVKTDDGQFQIERGKLTRDGRKPWSLSNDETESWLRTVRANQVATFGDLSEVKVGIKTTADSVFIKEDWESLGTSKPETKLLRHLITHQVAQRWAIQDRDRTTCKKVLYPYDLKQSKRKVVSLEYFPKTKTYLHRHRERLEGRTYVIESERKWYEIWVPHQPTAWAEPKIVWPDISEEPKFFLDESGAIVNGDCYWIKLRDGVDQDWLYLMLAVANSTVATKFYDTMFHNKLYAGRRRFMTQYVKSFPLPELESKLGRRIVRLVKKQVDSPTKRRETSIKTLVNEAFGFFETK